MYGYVLIAVFFVFIAIVLIGIYIFDQRRHESHKRMMAGWALSHNWSFTDAEDSRMNERYPHLFKCLQLPKRWPYKRPFQPMIYYASNIVEGSIGSRKICAFDYHYQTRNDWLAQNSYFFSAIILDSGLQLKPLSIRDTNSIDLAGEFWGVDDIKFESLEFNNQFHVKAPDKKWAYDVLHQETMKFLLGSPHFYLDFRNRYVIAYRKRPFKVADFEAAIQVITGILDRLPASVVQELKETPDPCPNCGDQSLAAHGFCQNCGAAIMPATEICVNCGTSVDGATHGSKSKTASVLLAVFLAYWTWLYTYKKDKWKFWVGLVLSIVLSVFVFATFGLGAFLIWPVWVGIWIWAIVDVAVKKDKWYRSY